MKLKSVLVSSAVALAVAAVVAVPAGASPSRPGARYVVAKHVCSRPAAGALACFAMRLVPAAADAPGARPYVAISGKHGPAGGFAPQDLAVAYGFDPSTPTNQTVAIIDAYNNPNALHDLNVFNSAYGLDPEITGGSGWTFKKVNQNGDPSPLPANRADWSIEISLDLQAVRGVCNDCRILLVEAKSASSFDLATAVRRAARLGATEISNSYGGPEIANEAPFIRNSYNQPGIVVTASTGDDGWYGWAAANDGSTGWSNNKPNTPSAYPTVVAVTGTNLVVDSATGARVSETVWNENGLHDSNGLSGGFWQGRSGASGGGCSKVFAPPVWQAAVAGYAGNGCKGKRLAGDVAALGDPNTGYDVYVTQDGGWHTYGGTSLSAPVVAALWALAGGAGNEKYPGKSLYDRLRYDPSGISDVTLGGNAFCAGESKMSCSDALKAQSLGTNPNNLLNGNHHYFQGWTGLLDCGYPYDGSKGMLANDGQCNAGPGYDGPSGVGAPSGLTMFQPTKITVKLNAPALLRLNTVQNWSATNFADGLEGATAVSYVWSWGDSSPTSTGAATSHKFTQAGTHKVTLTVTDSEGQTGVFTRTITVGVPPVAVISGPTSAQVGDSVTWRSGRSAAKSTGASITSRTWFLNGEQVGTEAALSGKFRSAGNYTLKLKVVDSAGLVGTKSITVHVTR